MSATTGKNDSATRATRVSYFDVYARAHDTPICGIRVARVARVHGHVSIIRDIALMKMDPHQ